MPFECHHVCSSSLVCLGQSSLAALSLKISPYVLVFMAEYISCKSCFFCLIDILNFIHHEKRQQSEHTALMS